MKLLLVVNGAERATVLRALELAIEVNEWEPADVDRAKRIHAELTRAPRLIGKIERGEGP